MMTSLISSLAPSEGSAAPLRIALLGSPEIVWAGTPLPIPRRQARALLFRMAAQAAPVPREQLCYLFWPDEPESAARRSLAHLLTHLRRALPAADLLLAANDQVGLDAGQVWSDVAAFERLLATPEPHQRPAALQRAVGLVRGPFLDGFSLPDGAEFEEWVTRERQSFELRHLEALAALIEHYTARGAYPEAIGAAQRYLAADELAEEIHRRLIELYAMGGDRSAALRQFERCCAILERELGISPLPETRAAYERALTGELSIENQVAAADDSPRSIVSPQFNVPSPPTPLIGRADELEEVCAIVQRPDVRLLTLSGPGGAGKTRLSLEAAARMREAFHDGAVFVALAPVHDPALVIAAIAHALDIRQSGDSPLTMVVQDVLRDQHMLLVLDNFEHVPAAAPLVAELLATAPGIKALVTSRSLLRISGEHVFIVPPLALPDLVNLPPVERLADYSAVALFLARVHAVAPAFQLTEANALAIAAICARLDGLPLALELAAARMKLLSPRQMLARLDRRLALLTDGPRDTPERQRTLRATIDWSYSLLDVGEQLLLGRLAVFAGGWTLEAAEAVSATVGELAIGVLDGLGALLDKHLIQQTIGADGEPRFAMLETIREYAGERLTARGEASAARHAHAAYFVDLAERAAPELRGAQQAAWFDRLDEEQANLRTALAWLDEIGDVDHLLQLAGALGRFWYMRSNVGEGRRWLDQGLDRIALEDSQGSDIQHRPSQIVARALTWAGYLATFGGDLVAGRARLTEGAALSRALEDEPNLVVALIGLSMVAGFAGDWADSRAFGEECAAIAMATGDTWALAMTRYGASRALMDAGADDAAQALIEESLALARSAGDPLVFEMGCNELSQMFARRGDLARARALLEEGLAYARPVNYRPSIALLLNNLGEVARATGDYDQAETCYVESLTLFRKLGNRVDVPRLIHNLGRVAIHRGELGRARQLFAESLSGFRELGSRRGIAECLAAFAALALAGGRPERAARLWGAAEAMREVAHVAMWAADRAEYERDVAALRTQLDEVTLDAAWAAGRTLAIEQAIAEALNT